MTDVFEMDESEAKLLEEQAAQEPEDQQVLETEVAEKEQEDPEPAGEPEKEAEPEAAKEVPLAVMLEERRARQAAQQELNEYREKHGKLEGRLEEIAKKIAPQEPSFDDDPAAALRHGQEQLAQQTAQHAEQIGEYSKQAEAQQAWHQFQTAVAADEQAFKQGNVHYDAAADFLRETRRGEYRALGVEDPRAIEQAVQNDAVSIAQGAMRQGKSVAQAVYDLAAARGFKPPQANGADTAADKLAQVEKGQAASKSLSQAGGNTEIQLSLEAIANMSDEEFSKIPDSEWRKIMGA